MYKLNKNTHYGLMSDNFMLDTKQGGFLSLLFVLLQPKRFMTNLFFILLICFLIFNACFHSRISTRSRIRCWCTDYHFSQGINRVGVFHDQPDILPIIMTFGKCKSRPFIYFSLSFGKSEVSKISTTKVAESIDNVTPMTIIKGLKTQYARE